MQQFGQIAFILGLLIAFVFGLGIEHPWVPASMAFLGVFVGLVNISIDDTNRFLITGIALEVSASAFKDFSYIGTAMTDVMIFVGGALLVVAFRVLFNTGLATLWKNPE